jgi:branched-chain amino acid transport system permease protein
MAVDATYLLQLTANGLVLGLVYALLAVGLSLIYGVLQIINFAHGELVMVGAFAMAFALPWFGLAYVPGVLVALVASCIVGWVVFEAFLSRLERDDFERSILVTIGLSMVILYGTQALFSATPRMVDTQFRFDGIDLGGINITWTRIVAAAVALAAFAALWFVLHRTQFGRAMRAISINREAALMVGLRPRAVARNAVILATALCGLAGAAIAPVQLVVPIMGQFLVFKAFAVVIIGGLGNMPGAIVAAIGLGVLESWIGGFTEIVWQEACAFVLMIAVLLWRPQGIFDRGASGVRVG